MDCDLQDQPEEIIKLYNKVQEGYDMVFVKRKNRKDKLFKKFTSKVFYKIYDYFTDTKTDSSIANFSIISNKVLQTLKRYKEQNRSYALFINLLGFKRTDITINHAKRETGKSSYTFKKLVNLAIDNIVSQSNKPLKLSIKFGFLISFISLVYTVWLITRYIIFGISVKGWTSVMVSIYFVAGLVFMNLGFIGLYIGKIFDEVKNRPLYIISETTWDKKENKK